MKISSMTLQGQENIMTLDFDNAVMYLSPDEISTMILKRSSFKICPVYIDKFNDILKECGIGPLKDIGPDNEMYVFFHGGLGRCLYTTDGAYFKSYPFVEVVELTPEPKMDRVQMKSQNDVWQSLVQGYVVFHGATNMKYKFVDGRLHYCVIGSTTKELPNDSWLPSSMEFNGVPEQYYIPLYHEI